MKKFMKGLLALGLAMGLGACNKPAAEEVTVTFFVNDVGGVFQEVKVTAGEKVARPATNPTRAGYTFADWYVSYDDEAELFDFDQAITKDTDVFAHWNLDYVPDTREWQLVGNFKNTAWPNVWKANDPTMKMTDSDPDDQRNIFKFTLEMGQYAEFKIKIIEDGWGTEANFNNYDPTQYNTADIVKAASGGTNLQVTTAGNYEVYWDTDYEKIAINRLGDAVGEGVTQDIDPDSVKQWYLVGGPNGWEDNDAWKFEANEAGDNYWLRNVVLLKDEQFKFRANGDWDQGNAGFGALAYNEGDTISAAAFNAENAEDPSSNIVVAGEQGIYSFQIIFDEDGNPIVKAHKFSVSETDLGLAGSFNGWSADGHAMTKAVDDTNPTSLVITYTYENLELTAGAEFKVKPMNTWEISFGDNGNNVKVEEAGTYTVTLVLTLGTAADTRGLTAVLTLTK